MVRAQHPSDEDGVNQIVRDLQELRASAGGPSYAEIVRRVTAARQARGVAGVVARPARTTVYDAFREGRARLDPDLVADIAAALDGDAESFRRRCLAARLATESASQVIRIEENPTEALAAVESAESEPADNPAEPEPALAPPSTSTRHRHPIALSLACLVLNVLGYVAVEAFHLPFFLDLTGTGIAAIALGPWYGVAVAVGTHLVGTTVHGVVTVPFVLVNILGALIWGYGVRSFGWGNSLGRYFALTIAVAAACSALATPILLILFGGDTGHEAGLTYTLAKLGAPFPLAVGAANLVMTIADRMIVGFLILTVVAGISRQVFIPGGRLFHALGALTGGSLAPAEAPALTGDEPAGPPAA